MAKRQGIGQGPRQAAPITVLPRRPREYYYRVRGRICGPVEFSCPSCAKYIAAKLAWNVWRVQCLECKTNMAVGLSIWFLPRHWYRSPWDHVLPSFKPGNLSFSKMDPVEPYRVPMVVGEYEDGGNIHTVKGAPSRVLLRRLVRQWRRWMNK
mgnify:CR=1 FL=1